MKKTYMIPTMKVAEMDMTDIIATSDGFAQPNNVEGYSEEGYEGGYAKENKALWDKMW